MARPAAQDLRHALSFDIEDWFHLVEIPAVEDPKLWPRLSAESSLVERYTDLILKICDRGRVRATFFILGWIADRHPALVRRIADAGHEIASHSFWHRKVYEMTPEQFRQDMVESLAAIRAAADVPILGFRAPSFSITPGTEWAFDVLLDLGFTYDTSLFPAPRSHGGYACPREPHRVTAPSGRTLAELPISIAYFGPGPLSRLCYCGGGYLRLLPLPLIERGIRQEAAAGRPTIAYLHPRDFAPDCPRVPMPLQRRFKCYVGLGTTARKVERLLERHSWEPCAAVVERALGAAPAQPSRPIRLTSAPLMSVAELPTPVRTPPAPEARRAEADRLVATVEPARTPPGRWPAPRSVPVSVLIPVKNEQSNIVECLRHLTWADELIVVDSQSTDQTEALAQAMGASVFQFRFDAKTGWPKKRNWALEHIPWRNQWVLIIDADEHITPELAAEIEDVVRGRWSHADPKKAGAGDAYWLNRKLIFMDRWIRGSGYYPSWNIRLFKHPVGRYERISSGDTQSGDNEVHEHVILSSGPAGFLRNDFLHYAYPDLFSWVEKHNRYTSWEAHTTESGNAGQLQGRLFGTRVERNRWLKQFRRRLPFRPTIRFVYGYFIRGGFRDGYPGYVICRLMAWYEFMSIAKHRELVQKQASSKP